MSRKKVDLTGKRVGKLKVLYPTVKRYEKNGTVIWMCKCDCGRFREVNENQLQFKKIKQCKECAKHRHVR